MRQVSIADASRSGFLFNAADPQSVTRVAKANRVSSCQCGEMLFRAGDPADGKHINLSGLMRTRIADENGKELTLPLLEPGDPFGETALLDGLPRTANATRIEAGGRSRFLGSSSCHHRLRPTSAPRPPCRDRVHRPGPPDMVRCGQDAAEPPSRQGET